jgi:hypothetical protein
MGLTRTAQPSNVNQIVLDIRMTATGNYNIWEKGVETRTNVQVNLVGPNSNDNDTLEIRQRGRVREVVLYRQEDIDSDLHHGDRTWGGFTVVFGYRDINNQPQTWSADVGKKKGGGSHHFDVDLYTQPGTWAVQTDLPTLNSKKTP